MKLFYTHNRVRKLNYSINDRIEYLVLPVMWGYCLRHFDDINNKELDRLNKTIDIISNDLTMINRDKKLNKLL